MPTVSPRNHGPAHVHVRLLFECHHYLGRYSLLGFPCFCKSIDMAGVGYGLTPMSRLSQHSSRRRPLTGKSLDSSSPSALSKKKTPKRKTLSSRYTAVIPSKRRKLGLNAIRDHPVDISGEPHQQTPESHQVAASPNACNGSEVSSKEKDAKPSGTRGRPRKANSKVKTRPKVNVRVKSSRGLNLEASACPVAKVLDLKENYNEEAHSSSAASLKPDLFPADVTTEAGSISDSLPNRASTLSLIENTNLNVGLQNVETNEAGTFLSARKNVADCTYAESKQNTESHMQGGKRGRGRKRGIWRASIQTSHAELRAAKVREAGQLNNESEIWAVSESQVQDSLGQDKVDGSSLLKQDPLLLESNFLRPSRKAKKKSKLEEHRLPPWDYVGKRVVVYWPHAKAWYAGKVIMYDDTSKKHKIKYDDSDEECISFRRHKVILEKSLSALAVDGHIPEKGVLPSKRVRFLAEDSTPHKPLQGDLIEEERIVEDNVLLSAFAPKHRVKEGFSETVCNGSLMGTGILKGIDAAPSDSTAMHKSSKKLMSSPALDMRRPALGDKGPAGGKEGFVYVRRTKGRRKVDVSLAEMALDGGVDELNSASTAHQQDTSRKRKVCHSFTQQTAHLEFSDCRFFGNESIFSDVPDSCGVNGGGSNASERASRKRNKRSLKKLVSQASIVSGTQISLEAEPQEDQTRKQRARRSRRKFARKQKLKNAVFSARNRRLSTKRVLRLAGNVDGLAFEGSSPVFCRDASKLYSIGTPANDMLLHKSNSLFFCSINLRLPVMTPALFTWQLFSIMTCTHLCDEGSFDEKVSVNGSMGDWIGIFRILLRIVKAVPVSAYMNGRQWQSTILYELWNSMARCREASADALGFLPHEAETSVFKLLFGASANCRMTNREILNLFVFYFLKPYIFSTVCEKGVSIQVAVQQFLLLLKGKGGRSTCFRQSVKRFPLCPSYCSADEGFSSYLMHFPWSADWCTRGGLFLGQMEGWSTTTGLAGSAEGCIPITAIGRLDTLVWQVKSARLVIGESAFGALTKKGFMLNQENTEIELLNEFHSNFVRHEVRNCAFKENHDRSGSGPCDGYCLKSGLLLTASLQKRLNQTFGKGLGSSEVCDQPVAISSHLGKAVATTEQTFSFDQTKVIGGLGSVGAEDASEFKISAPHSKFMTTKDRSAYSCFHRSSSQDVNASKQIKEEPDTNFSLRNSSITMESISAAVRKGSSGERLGHQQPLGSFLLEPDVVGERNQSKIDEQYFSGQFDQEYYDSKFLKGAKMGKKIRPRYRSLQQRFDSKERPTDYCIADLLVLSNDNVERELGARVDLQSNADGSFLIAAHVIGKSFEQKIVEGGMLARNPSELIWKSGSGWALQFPDREQWELFRCMYNELCLQATRATCVREIPIPDVKQMMEILEGNSQPKSCLRPFFAIKSPDEEIEAAFRTGRILYDLDSEDESWMAETNRVNKGSGIENISDDTLEQIIDRLEKEAFRRGEAIVAVHDAVEFCQGLAMADTVQEVHAYWSRKRLSKGKPLLRHFQPPLWEQYQDELRAWETKMQQYSPDTQNALLDRYPRPIMSAFCLQSRSLDSLDTSKRMMRQRSQRKIRPTSRSSSEDSHRLPAYRHVAGTRHVVNRPEHATTTLLSTVGLHQQDHSYKDGGIPEAAKAARSKAVEARKVAETRALKSQRRFLEFDLSLQRAWAFLIEYAVAGSDASAQREPLEKGIAHLLSRCSSLLSREDDSSEDEPPSHSGQVCRDVGDEFLEAFTKKCSLNGKVVLCNGRDKVADDDIEEMSPLLPISVKGSSYVWNGSSLL